jgi:AcrR family transcriptional regulator
MPQKRLTRQDWIDAALEALETGGVPAVAVEPLASRLGVTKGSFYWHFKDRNELLATARLVDRTA